MKRLRELYKQKYEAELAEIKKDPAMLKAPKARKESKGTSSRGTSGSKGSSGSSSSGSSSKSSKKPQAAKEVTEVAEAQEAEEIVEPTQKERMADAIEKLRASFPQMTDKQRVEAYKLVKKLIKQYRKMIEG